MNDWRDGQDDNRDWQEAQHQDECEMRRQGVEILVHARRLGLPDEQCMAIAAMAGLVNDFYKEIRQ